MMFSHCCLSLAIVCHFPPMFFTMSSYHLVFFLPGVRLFDLGIHSVSFFAHLWLSILMTCPAHLHFVRLTSLLRSSIFIMFLILWLLTLSYLRMLSILLNILYCVTSSFFDIFLVRAQV
uniref:Uncharacterized protein n=1 Tax=Cacopsylla melanoneura TaxID=428564 RepID=A0A8D8WFH0_9HEMI